MAAFAALEGGGYIEYMFGGGTLAYGGFCAAGLGLVDKPADLFDLLAMASAAAAALFGLISFLVLSEMVFELLNRRDRV